MSAFGLSRQIGTDRNTAQEYMNLYFARYPGVKTYMENIRKTARQQGYVETEFGRRLYTPDINASNMQRRQGAERAAINAPMQGTAADIMKKAMINVDQWLQTTNIDARMIMQVHDELILEVAKDVIEPAKKELSHCMTSATQLHVPLIVDVGVGANWDKAH